MEAQSDAVPPYWETTAVVPAGFGESGDMVVDGLPTGNVVIFGFNIFASFLFQFLGFVITYFLSNTHAAKYGSRAGLGLTLIQYGAYWKTNDLIDEEPTDVLAQRVLWGNMTSQSLHPIVYAHSIKEASNSSSAAAAIFDFLFKNDKSFSNFTSTEYGQYGGGFKWSSNDWFALFFMTLGTFFTRRGVCLPLT
jgi:Protein of unknown function (DUF2370)